MKRPPLIRVFCVPGTSVWGAGEARYYGWRWIVNLGPFTVCLFPVRPQRQVKW